MKKNGQFNQESLIQLTIEMSVQLQAQVFLSKFEGNVRTKSKVFSLHISGHLW